ncbi:chemotaxis protein CheB [Pseudomonas sp. NPDC098747]|uniref:chemotaxis protein CheB n=1 Tax=Pseudomonas sp. NPDC098747 TaxID=3364487 RepID=UPI00383BE380
MTSKKFSLATGVKAESNRYAAIVGLGASAGGLEALEVFLRSMPVDSGYAFVVIQHLNPAHPSLLTEILARSTNMPVQEISHRVRVCANQVYVIPPNHSLSVQQSRLLLSPLEHPSPQRLPIDGFFSSLAEQQGPRAVGIILSGTGSDGTQGCRSILEHGGLTLAQTPDEAAYNGMPTSVMKAGYASQILPVHSMVEALLERRRAKLDDVADIPIVDTAGFPQILSHLRQVTGHDFTQYKRSTLMRRIERRMQLHRISDARAYAKFLDSHPEETRLLFSEVLINVTRFFRDPEAFVVMKGLILPSLLANKPPDYVFRVWVAGCASGEEAYTVAILLHELMEQHQSQLIVKFFATDLDDDAIRTARYGLYPLSIAQDVSAERLQRYFYQQPTGYLVKKEIREMIVFAVQNVIKDPPFTRLDLLCCRNLMIYLGPQLQMRLIPTFHYALKPNGVLFLSPSESIGNHGALFTSLHRKWKFYQAHNLPIPKIMTLNSPLSWVPERVNKLPDRAEKMTKEFNVVELTRRILLQDFVPASVVTDLLGNIVYIHGDTGNYLRPAPGQATLNIIDMAREGLQMDLRNAIRLAVDHGEPTLHRKVSITGNGLTRDIHLSVRRLSESLQGERLLLISFGEPLLDYVAAGVELKPASPATLPHERIKVLERDLTYTRENLQASINELQNTNEELSSTNEELQSTNEELQSSNEELETSREELESINEELVTVNAELQDKIEQLGDMQNDMKNFLDSTHIGTIFLNAQLTIRRFTRDAAKIYSLIPSDVGRPLADITSCLDGTDLLVPAQQVIDTLIPYDVEVCTTSGNWFLARLLPYRTFDNVIDGVVLTFHDINTRVANELATQAARELAEAIIDTVIEPLLVLDDQLHVVSASRSYYQNFPTTATATVGLTLYELGHGQWNILALREQLGTILEGDTSFEGFVVEQEVPGCGVRTITLNARRVTGAGARPHLILLAMQINPQTPRGPHEHRAY